MMSHAGGIIRSCINENGVKIFVFALVQGRATGKWSFPKGHCNANETTYDCALREIKEETGLSLIDDEGEKILKHKAKLKQSMYYFFHIDYAELTPIDIHEISNVKWFTIEEMARLDFNQGIKLFLKRINYFANKFE